MGEAKRRALIKAQGASVASSPPPPAMPIGPLVLQSFAGKVQVKWDNTAAVTPMGQLSFFIEFLKVSGVFDELVASCPLKYESGNASSNRDIIGTLLLSILAGHQRYAHISSVRMDQVNPHLLGMSRVVSEDTIRRAFKSMDEEAAIAWLEYALQRCYRLMLSSPWIMDVDTTVKVLYGHQEGAVVGYNPHKPGRPSHSYHSYMMSNTRLIMNVEVQPGNQSAPKFGASKLWELLQTLPSYERPYLIRGDIAFGNEGIMSEAERLEIPYLFKLRQTKQVKQLITQLFSATQWEDAGQGWKGIESTLQLQGWSRARRVIVLRRQVKEHLGLTQYQGPRQLTLNGVQVLAPGEVYEYAILITSRNDAILSMAQLYRDRADCENHFDELKNQWGWAGYTSKDMKRCRIISRLIALTYNWWSLFVRLAHPDTHLEAITSRPLLLNAVARRTEHAGQQHLTITSSHADTKKAQRKLTALSQFLNSLTQTAEQLTDAQRWYRILSRAFYKLFGGVPLTPPQLALP
jgi:Transposase DDE domain group 1